MSIAAATARIDEIQQQIQTLWPSVASGQDAKTQAVNATSFAAAIAGAQEAGPYLTTEVIGQDIVDLAEKYVGVRHTEGGDTYNGVDDSGLYYRVLADLGVDVPRTAAEQAGVGFEVGSLTRAKPGDLLVGNDGHVAIYAGDGKIIHAPKGGTQVEKVDNPYTDATLATIRRVVPESYGYAGTSQPAAHQATAAQAIEPSAAQAPGAAITVQATASAQAAVSRAAQLLISAQTASAAQAAAGIGADDTADSVLSTAFSSLGGNAVSQAVVSALGEQGTSAVAAAAATALSSATVDGPSAASQTSPLTPAVRTAFTQQVSAPVVNLAQSATGDQTMTLRVSPENLGPITLKAQIVNGTVHIELASATDAGRDALRQILTDLRRDLAGISSASTLTVAAGDSSTGGQSQSQQAANLLNGGGSGSGRGGDQQQGPRGEGAPQSPHVTVPAPAPPTAPSVPGARIDLYA